MKEGLKIVTIGGGSSYTPELIEGLIKYNNELPVRELWLVDIEEGKEKLEIVGNLAKRMVQKGRSSDKNLLDVRPKRSVKVCGFRYHSISSWFA